MILIGNKPYNNLKLDKIIDNFDKNIRQNFGMPNNNNGTKIYIQYLNIHVYDNLIKKDNIQKYYSKIDQGYLKTFKDFFKINNYHKILRQNNNEYRKYNDFLKKNNCPYTFTKIPRVGCNSIFYCLLNNINPVYITNYSLIENDNNKHFYNNCKTSDCHNVIDEINIIKWLHNNNYLDATLSNLNDTTLPVFDCSIIYPKISSIKMILNEYGICILNNYYSNSDIDKIINETNKIFREKKDKIQILDKENCSNDERIFHAERYSELIKNKFSNNKFLTECAQTFNRPLNKKTLINKIVYEEGKIKNSGAGWHRDNHDCQFKTIMYLSDVNDKNGNFQFLSNSSKKHIGYPTPRTPSYNTRYHDKTIDDIITNNNDVKLFNIVGKKGTIILANTTYIHRGNIIKEGTRTAITQYYFT